MKDFTGKTVPAVYYPSDLKMISGDFIIDENKVVFKCDSKDPKKQIDDIEIYFATIHKVEKESNMKIFGNGFSFTMKDGSSYHFITMIRKNIFEFFESKVIK